MSQTILNFHGVGTSPRCLGEGEMSCWLEEQFFNDVLDIVSVSPRVRLTVDDGNYSDFSVILPALLRRGLKATFFICSGRLEQSAFLGRAQVRELRERGMEIGSHGVNHVSWRGLAPGQLVHELEESRRVLAEVCGADVDAAACPFGGYDRTVMKALGRSGYRIVYTSDAGDADGFSHLQPRITVIRSMTLDHIRTLARSGSGFWCQTRMRVAQVVKRLR